MGVKRGNTPRAGDAPLRRVGARTSSSAATLVEPRTASEFRVHAVGMELLLRLSEDATSSAKRFHAAAGPIGYLYLIGCRRATFVSKFIMSSTISVPALRCSVCDDEIPSNQSPVSSNSYITSEFPDAPSLTVPRNFKYGAPAPKPMPIRTAVLPRENSTISFSRRSALLVAPPVAARTTCGTIAATSNAPFRSRCRLWRAISNRSFSLSSLGFTAPAATGSTTSVSYPPKSNPSAIHTLSMLSVRLYVMPPLSEDFSFGADAQPDSMIIAVRISRQQVLCIMVLWWRIGSRMGSTNPL